MAPMTVRELIRYLESFDQDLPIVYELHSEYRLLEAQNIRVRSLHPARNDGWVHSFDHTQHTVPYLIFPGN